VVRNAKRFLHRRMLFLYLSVLYSTKDFSYLLLFINLVSIQSIKIVFPLQSCYFFLEFYNTSFSLIDFIPYHFFSGFVFIFLLFLRSFLNSLLFYFKSQTTNLFNQINIFFHNSNVLMFMNLRVFLKVFL
jgi:hypothetical protein